MWPIVNTFCSVVCPSLYAFHILMICSGTSGSIIFKTNFVRMMFWRPFTKIPPFILIQQQKNMTSINIGNSYMHIINLYVVLIGCSFKTISSELQVQMICYMVQLMYVSSRSSTEILIWQKHGCHGQYLFLIRGNCF